MFALYISTYLHWKSVFVMAHTRWQTRCAKWWYDFAGSSLIAIFPVTLACHPIYKFLCKVIENRNADYYLFGIINLLHYFVLQFKSQHTYTCTDLMSCVLTLQLPWCVGRVAERICTGLSTPVYSWSGQLAIFWRLFEQPQCWQLLFLCVLVWSSFCRPSFLILL